jgi:hypothetical protein
VGERIAARLTEADEARRVVRFTHAPGAPPEPVA